MKSFALARVLQLAERRSETLSRAVKQAHGLWLRARGRQVQLAALRDAHIALLALDLKHGVSAAQVREASRLQHAQAEELRAAQAAIDAAHAEWRARLDAWLAEQVHAREAPEQDALHPVRYGMVMRARLAQHLLDSGSDDTLRSEVFITALFAQIDRLLDALTEWKRLH